MQGGQNQLAKSWKTLCYGTYSHGSIYRIAAFVVRDIPLSIWCLESMTHCCTRFLTGLLSCKAVSSFFLLTVYLTLTRSALIWQRKITGAVVLNSTVESSLWPLKAEICTPTLTKPTQPVEAKHFLTLGNKLGNCIKLLHLLSPISFPCSTTMLSSCWVPPPQLITGLQQLYFMTPGATEHAQFVSGCLIYKWIFVCIPLRMYKSLWVSSFHVLTWICQWYIDTVISTDISYHSA